MTTDTPKKPPRKALHADTVIDCYRITKLIGSGGFSLIYQADDEDTDERVIIKEYLPKKMAIRRAGSRMVEVVSPDKAETFNQGRKLFYQEARALAKLDHPHIVRVRNFFLENGTAYLVMDYERGKNLGGYIKRRKGHLSTRFLLTVFPPLLDALSLIHAKSLLHLDIKPSNIHLRPGGNPLLLDFGAAHQYEEKHQSKTSQVVTPGFSPVEQYYSRGKVGPWSDVYAIGASMRASIEGRSPPAATKRNARDTMEPAVSAFQSTYPGPLLEAIDWAMAIDAKNRPQSAREFRDVLLKSAPGWDAHATPTRSAS